MSSMLRSALLLLLVACGQADDERQFVTEQASAPAAALGDMAAARAPEAMPAPQAPAQVLPLDSLPASMVIRTGTAEVEVAALEPAVDSARALVARLGGQVVDLSLQVGQAQRREARIVARVPSERFDGAVAGLASIGDVEAVNVSAQDVGEEYVDLQAQLANRRRLETRLLELLDTRTGDLEDVLAVERELARVREEMDRQEGRLRYLRNRVALSTLTIVLHEPAPLISDYSGQNVFLDALRAAWRNFIGLLLAVIASLGVVVPLALLAWLAWRMVRAVRRRRSLANRDNPAP